MPTCLLCGSHFPTWQTVGGVRRNLSSRNYCLECSPRGKHNNRRLHALPELDRAPKRCTRCGVEKPVEDFYLRPDGRRSHSWCKLCNTDHRKARFRQDRLQALEHCSGGDIQCVCCGERRIEFLALDHVTNDGAAHRRTVGAFGGRPFYSWLRRTRYTYDALVVACHNCNVARAMYGQCPHQAKPP